MKSFITLNKLKPGDKVAVVSPSAGLPELFPWVQDLGLERIRDVFSLVPVEYPTTRKMNSSLEDRAADLMVAFADPEIKAVIASIGGDDAIRLIKYLKPEVFINNPKPFFGYSDSTHFHVFLWNLGIPSFYGGAVMTQFAMQKEMHPTTTQSLKTALFSQGIRNLESSDVYNDKELQWSDKSNLTKSREWEKNENVVWDGDKEVSGLLWGGCVESLIVQSTTGKYLPSDEDLDGTVLFIETAEDIPDHWIIEYLLTGFGERGWFDRFNAILVGRPKAWSRDKQNNTEAKAKYRQEQRDIVLKTVRHYNQNIPIIQNLDFGHTDPQVILPYGNTATISCKNKTIKLNY